MGQYYYVCNLDKKEYLHPHKFNDGLKLLEFGHGGLTMTGLALLLTDANGRGGGDLCRSVRWEADKPQPDGWEPRQGEKVLGEETLDPPPQGDRYRVLIPEVSGRWKGDRIVVAGDYADPTPGSPPDPNYNDDRVANLHGLCSIPDEHWKDISLQVVEALMFDEYIRTSMRE